MTPSPEEMAAWVMRRMDEWTPLHRLHSIRHPDPRCPWCALVSPPRDLRSDEDVLLASAGALS